jgi:hypothetical protein
MEKSRIMTLGEPKEDLTTKKKEEDRKTYESRTPIIGPAARQNTKERKP